jgi:hypothetical protein
MCDNMFSFYSHKDVIKNWVSKILNRHPNLVSKFSQRLDRQGNFSEDITIMKDYFRKVLDYNLHQLLSNVKQHSYVYKRYEELVFQTRCPFSDSIFFINI